MKKVLALMLALVLVLSLAACGGNSVEEKKNVTSTEATEEGIFVGPPKPDTTKILSEQSQPIGCAISRSAKDKGYQL